MKKWKIIWIINSIIALIFLIVAIFLIKNIEQNKIESFCFGYEYIENIIPVVNAEWALEVLPFFVIVNIFDDIKEDIDLCIQNNVPKNIKSFINSVWDSKLKNL
jgi:hypothetical protein